MPAPILRLALNSHGDFLGEAEVYWLNKGPQLIDIYRKAAVFHSGSDGSIAAVARFSSSVQDTLRTQLLEHFPDLAVSSSGQERL
jgi:hypothetical protein